MPAVSAVFTLARVAEMLGEDEDRLDELSLGMWPDHGCLWVHGAGGEETKAFTQAGIEDLKQLIANARRQPR